MGDHLEDGLSVTSDVHRYWNDEMMSGRTSPALSNSSASCVASSPSMASTTSSSSSPPPPQCSPPESPTSAGMRSSVMTSPEKERYRSRKPNRMASSFALGDEQPDNLPARKSRNKGDSFDAIFGSPLSKSASNRRCASAAPVSNYQRRKMMPINPLTGQVLGSSTVLDVPLAPAPVPKVHPNYARFKRPPPGGYAAQLW